MNKLLVRALSGAIYVALIVGATMMGATWFAALMSIFTALAVYEFERDLCGVPDTNIKVVVRVLDVLAALAIVNFAVMEILPAWAIISTLVLVGVYPLTRFTLALYDKSPGSFASVAYSILSLVYIAVPLLLLQFVYNDAGSEMHIFVLAMFVMIWLNDTGAFLVGSSFGKHRLFERLSPKKSWEGFFGGLIFCILAGIGCYFILPELEWSLLLWIGYGVLICILATWGDLFESLFKRSIGIKDSGTLIPGHGGILDRIDSLLFVAVGTFIYFYIFS